MGHTQNPNATYPRNRSTTHKTQQRPAQTHTNIHTHTNIRTHTNIHTHKYTHTHTNIHTHKYTHTHTQNIHTHKTYIHRGEPARCTHTQGVQPVHVSVKHCQRGNVGFFLNVP